MEYILLDVIVFLLLVIPVRKAYYQLSLKVHPDRVPKNELTEATKKFQALSKIYDILSDTVKRSLYDETGKLVILLSTCCSCFILTQDQVI